MVRVCGNYDDAEDALADALFAAIKASDQLRDPTTFRAWLTTIGSRACMRKQIRERLLRRASLSQLEAAGIEVKDDLPAPDLEAEAQIMRGCVRGAVDSLSDIYRDVYLRREIQGETAEEVSQALGLSVAAVKSRLHRARQIVRDSLDNGFGCAELLTP